MEYAIVQNECTLQSLYFIRYTLTVIDTNRRIGCNASLKVVAPQDRFRGIFHDVRSTQPPLQYSHL